MVRKVKNDRKKYENFKKNFNFMPVEFSNYSARCPNGHINHIDLLKKHPCLKPVKVGKGQLITTHFTCKCDICGIDFPQKIDNVVKKKKTFFFGDEAFRGGTIEDDNIVAVYSLVGVNSERILKVEEKLLLFKQNKIQEVNPLHWKIHMKEIVSSDKRAKMKGFENKNYEFAVNFINELYDLVNEMIREDDLFVVNSISVDKNSMKKDLKKEVENIKHNTYLSLIFNTINMSTKNGTLPEFILDAEKPVKERSVIQGWAEEIFNSGEYTLLFPLISRGLLIEEPKFVIPGFRPLLEIADMICFTIARYIDAELRGKNEEIFYPNKIGMMWNIINFADGSIWGEQTDKFPINLLKI